MAQIQFSLIKKIKIGRPEQWLTPTSLRPIASHFCLTLPSPLHPSQSGRHMCITLYWRYNPGLVFSLHQIKMSKQYRFIL